MQIFKKSSLLKPQDFVLYTEETAVILPIFSAIKLTACCKLFSKSPWLLPKERYVVLVIFILFCKERKKFYKKSIFANRVLNKFVTLFVTI